MQPVRPAPAWRRSPAVAGVLLVLVAAMLALLGSALTGAATAAAGHPQDGTSPESVELVLYWGEGCPKCAAEKDFLADLQAGEPRLDVELVEVYQDDAGRARFEEHAEQLGVDASAVPTTVLDERVWIGFTESIEQDIREVVADALAGRPVPAGVYGRPGVGTCDGGEVCEVEPDASVDVPLLGPVDLGGHSLVFSTLVIGFVDGFNPCSLWVISVLLAIVIHTGSRRRVLAVGSVFLLVTTIMYALFMAGIYGAMSVVGYLSAIQVAVAVVAGIFGLVAVKDYFWWKKGVSFSIPDSSKPGIYARMRRVAGQQALLPALGATAVLAVGVSLLETPCTAGFPVLWTGLLESNDVPLVGSALLFGLYMLPFLLDELAVFAVAVVTMRATRMQERHGRLLKLVAGTTMLALAVTMAVEPEVMESVTGASLVFLGAGAVAALVHLVAQRRTRAPS